MGRTRRADSPAPYRQADPSPPPRVPVTLDRGRELLFRCPVPEPGKPCWCRRYERYADVLGG